MMIFYLIGALISFILLVLLAMYYKSIGDDNTQFAEATVICIMSWIAVIMLCVCYHEQLIILFKNIFNRHDNTPV